MTMPTTTELRRHTFAPAGDRPRVPRVNLPTTDERPAPRSAPVPVPVPAPASRTLVDRVRDLQGPQSGGWALVPLGGRLFDVVITVGGEMGSRVITMMDEIECDDRGAGEPACGPVIEDPDHGWLFWLVPPGTSERWQPHGDAACLGQPHVLSLPPLSRTRPPGVFWRRRLRGDRLVSPAPLYDLFDRASGPGRNASR
ncbi:hypothetical protein RKD38_003908 [Streptomyces ambofaciens]